MKKYYTWIMLGVLGTLCLAANEFIVPTGKAVKKEKTNALKQDIADLLEAIMRQLSVLLKEQAHVQDEVLDTIRHLLDDTHASSFHKAKKEDLIKYRKTLQEFIKILREQSKSMHTFSQFKKTM